MNDADSKEKIYTEIRQAIKYLMREKDKGREQFEISDFFRKELKEEIVSNFENRITIPEYEKVVYSLLGGKTEKSRITENMVYQEVQKLIRQYRMRSKKQILQKIAAKFRPLPSQIDQLRDFLNSSYNKLMKEPLYHKITAIVRDGITDKRRLFGVLRREHYDVDKEIIEETYNRVLGEQEKKKSRFSRGTRKSIKFDVDYNIRDTQSQAKKRLREQMKNTLIRKTRYKKQRFVTIECPKFRFKQTKESIEDEKIILEHEGEVKSSRIIVKSTISKSRVLELNIICARTNAKQGAVINVFEFQKYTGKKQAGPFLQRWVKNVVSHMPYSNIQEIIWFLSSILNEKFGLPSETGKYLKTNFLPHLGELDKTINHYVIEKALEQI
ncbi:hypothetical protein ACFL6I_09920 [candidate division KSB1 bacterium]